MQEFPFWQEHGDPARHQRRGSNYCHQVAIGFMGLDPGTQNEPNESMSEKKQKDTAVERDTAGLRELMKCFFSFFSFCQCNSVFFRKISQAVRLD